MLLGRDFEKRAGAKRRADARRSGEIAALCAVSGMAALGLTDNFVPFITERGSLWQFHFVRGVMAVAILMVLAALGFGILRPRRFWAVAGRSLFQAGAMLIYFGCLAFLPIGVVVAAGAAISAGGAALLSKIRYK